MAVIHNEGLYPPIVQPIQPAILTGAMNKVLRFYFSTSPYMDWKELKTNPTEMELQSGGYWIQVTITDQKTNKTVLNSAAYPYGIKPIEKMLSPYERGDTTDEESLYRYNHNMYRCEVATSSITSPDALELGKYYRIQARVIYLGGLTADYLDVFNVSGTPYEQWRQAIVKISRMNLDTLNEAKYENVQVGVSEWSTVTLAKLIGDPQVYVNTILMQRRPVMNEITAKTQLLQIYGNIIMGYDNGEIETVNTISAQLERVYNNGDIEIIEASGQIIPTTTTIENNFSYKFKVLLTQSSNYYYRINLYYTTKNGFFDRFFIKVNPEYIEPEADITLDYSYLPEYGWTELEIAEPAAVENRDIVVVRSDSRSGFKKWEELFIVHLSDSTTPPNYAKVKDVTNEYGIWYRYALQVLDENGVRGPLQCLDESKTIIANSDRIYLVNSLGQLSLSYNATVSSVVYNLQETKVETLGSKYPWTRRNSAVSYKSFSLSSTISYNDNNESYLKSFSVEDEPEYDKDNLREVNINRGFKSKENLFPLVARQLYEEYNFKNRIDNFNDIILEREYRNAFISFIQSGKPLLFKSPAEGNILVRVMNFSFTPETQLFNLVYSFSCEGNEIDSCTILNYDKYNIQPMSSAISSISTLPDYKYSQTVEKRGSL